MNTSKVVIVSAFLATTAVAGQGGPGGSDRPSPGINESQITITLMGRRPSRFQATVIAKGDRDLKALTAAHCLADAEAGQVVQVRRGRVVLSGRIGKVFRNPAYQETRFPQFMGTDNAIVSLHVAPEAGGEAVAFEEIRAVDVVAGPFPPPAGGKIVAHIPDQHGKEHVIPAGNFSNPKLLTWGPRFHPIGGDSGAGVFVLRDASGGEPAPILIGSVVGADDRGGGASLINKRNPWVERALKE